MQNFKIVKEVDKKGVEHLSYKFEHSTVIYSDFIPGNRGGYDYETGITFIIEDEEVAKELINNGWNVKYYIPKDYNPEEVYDELYEGREPSVRDIRNMPSYRLNAVIRYKEYDTDYLNKLLNPRVKAIINDECLIYNEETLNQLDGAMFKVGSANITLNAHIWTKRPPHQVKAFVKSFIATVEDWARPTDVDDYDDLPEGMPVIYVTEDDK